MTLPPDPSQDSDAAWFHSAVRRVKAARDAGDEAEVARLREYVRREGGDQLARLMDQVITAADAAAAAEAAGTTMPRQSLGANAPGELLCDFCTAADPIAYYPFTEFHLTGPGGEYASGDRWYVCARCFTLLEADDWRGLRDWVGPTARNPGVQVLWNGFRMNRSGPAVFVDPGTNPEEDRP